MFIILGNYYHYLSAGWWLVLHTELKIVCCCNNAATLRKKIMMKIQRSCRKCLIFSGKCLFNIFFFLSSSQFHHWCHVLGSWEKIMGGAENIKVDNCKWKGKGNELLKNAFFQFFKDQTKNIFPSFKPIIFCFLWLDCGQNYLLNGNSVLQRKKLH